MITYQDKVLLFVGAHPDDETMGIGRTLAKYSALGVKTYYACATRGEAGDVDEEYLRGFASKGDVRWFELENAAQRLGLSGVFHLGFRDSGMLGWDDNNHPDALYQASEESRRDAVVKAIREIKPNVLITHDNKGGYGHIDHIAISKATFDAFYLSSNASYKPELGLPHRVDKFYYNIMNFRLLKKTVGWLKLTGRDPRHMGRNKDIDWEAVLDYEVPESARITIDAKSAKAQEAAKLCYPSQIAPGKRPGDFLKKFLGKVDYFYRVEPKDDGTRIETDLFEGIL